MKILSLSSLLIIFLSSFTACSKQAEMAKDSQPESIERSISSRVDSKTARRLEIDAVNSQERRKKLVKYEELREAHALADTRMPLIRDQIFYSKRDEWAGILKKFDAEYQELRRQAALTKHKMVDCTICGGDTYMDYCLFCNGDSDGLCSECEGTGKYIVDDICPPCKGTGKCYLCSGTGMMMCLFCDDGNIDLALPPHYETMILY